MARGDPVRPATEGRRSKATQGWTLTLGILRDFGCDCFHLLLEPCGNQPAKYATPGSKLFPKHSGLCKYRSYAKGTAGGDPANAGDYIPGHARDHAGGSARPAFQLFSCQE